jgi:hypothetical protein
MKKSFQEQEAFRKRFQKWSIFYAILLIGVLGFLFLGMPNSILYAHEGFLRWPPFILIFLVIPVLLFRVILQFASIFGSKLYLILAIPIASVLVLGPSYGVYTGYLSHKDLLENGIKTKGIIIEKFRQLSRRGIQNDWLIKCEFKVDSLKFSTFSEHDKYNMYKPGDTITIIYSKKNPQNNRILFN